MPISATALQRLSENHRQFLRFIERRVGSQEAAEDILQDAFVRGLEKGGMLRNEESVVAWFYRVLRNGIVDYYRKGAANCSARKDLPGRRAVAPSL